MSCLLLFTLDSFSYFTPFAFHDISCDHKCSGPCSFTSVPVATPIEQEVNGVERMRDMESRSTNDGRMTLTIPFARGTDLDTAQVVTRALREQNIQVAAGGLGQQPAPTGQDFQYTINALGRLIEEQQFADIIIKTGDYHDGAGGVAGASVVNGI